MTAVGLSDDPCRWRHGTRDARRIVRDRRDGELHARVRPSGQRRHRKRRGVDRIAIHDGRVRGIRALRVDARVVVQDFVGDRRGTRVVDPLLPEDCSCFRFRRHVDEGHDRHRVLRPGHAIVGGDGPVEHRGRRKGRTRKAWHQERRRAVRLPGAAGSTDGEPSCGSSGRVGRRCRRGRSPVANLADGRTSRRISQCAARPAYRHGACTRSAGGRARPVACEPSSA